jgi:hypothetical protein
MIDLFTSGAIFSPKRHYRYRLWRVWGDPKKRCVFVGLNPSIADEQKDDMTVKKCIAYARRWGFGALDVVNLFAFISTDPKRLISARNPVGLNNDKHIAKTFETANRIVWAWGTHPSLIQRLVLKRQETARFFAIPRECKVGSLGATRDGSPRHPSRTPYALPFTNSPRKIHF